MSCTERDDLVAGVGGPVAVLWGCGAADAGLSECERALMYGVVPDGVGQVVLETGAGESQVTTVQNNVYAFEASLRQHPKAVHYVGVRGPVTQKVPFYTEEQ